MSHFLEASLPLTRLLCQGMLGAALAANAAGVAAQSAAPSAGTQETPGQPVKRQASEPGKAAAPAVAGADGRDATPATQTAQDKDKARRHFRMGVKFYREGNYRSALVEFRRAYKLAPHYKLKFNMGQTAVELQDYAYAIENLNAYLSEGGSNLPKRRRALVQQIIADLDARLAMVTITSNQAQAAVYVDDRLIGHTPLARPVPVGAGPKHVVAIKDGYPTVDRRIDLAAGDTVEMRLDFKDPIQSEPVVVTKVLEKGLGLTTWMSIGTGVLATSTAVLVVVTGLAKQQYEDELQRETSPERLETLHSRAETRALLTDIALGVTSAAAVATAVAILTSDDEKAEGPRQQTAQGFLRFGHGGHTELGVRGRF